MRWWWWKTIWRILTKDFPLTNQCPLKLGDAVITAKKSALWIIIFTSFLLHWWTVRRKKKTKALSRSQKIRNSKPLKNPKSLLNSFHLMVTFIGFYPQTRKEVTFYSILNSTAGKYCSVAFIWMVTLKDFTHRIKSKNYLVQHNKQQHRKVLLSSFHLNGHT